VANVYFNEQTGISRVQIPKALATAFGLGKGSKVDFKVVDGKIQIDVVK
jgi:antitoxin component of MazEF toxin-antitoxin module